MASKKRTKFGVNDEEWHIHAALLKEFGRLMPKADAIAGQVLEDVRVSMSDDLLAIRRNISDVITKAFEEMSKQYFERERSALGNALFAGFVQYSTNGGSDGVLEAIRKYPKALDEFFLSVSQGRKARAGSSFEKILAAVFDMLGYTFTEQPKIDGNPDFVFPDIGHYQRAAMDCIVFTAKTTLRERWRQITTEGARGGLMFLATLDDSITHEDLDEMSKQHIYVVVPRQTKAARYGDHVNVISFEHFLEHHLDPGVKRWNV